MTAKYTRTGFLIVIMGFHLLAPLIGPGGGVLMPEVILFSFFIVTGTVLALLKKTTLLQFFALNALLVASMLLNQWPGGTLSEHLNSAINLNFGLVLALSLTVYLMGVSQRQPVERWMRRTLMLILALSVLEITFAPFEAVVDAFRGAIYQEFRLYNVTQRDIALYGFARPTFFGNEPSYLGITVTAMAIFCFVLARTAKAQMAAIALLLAAVVIVRSPTAVAMTIIAVYMFFSTTSLRRMTPSQGLILLLSPIVIGLAAIVFYQQFGDRFALFLSGNDNSGDLRLIKPLEAIWVSVQSSPLFGTGIGGRAQIATDMLAFGDWGRHVGALERLALEDIYSTGTMLVFTEMGLSAVLMLTIIYGMFRKLIPMIRPMDFVITAMSVSITMGGWTHPRPWLVMALLLVAIHLRRTQLAAAAATASQNASERAASPGGPGQQPA